MSRFWFAFRDRSGRVWGVLIMGSWSLLHARSRVAVKGLDRETQVYEPHELEGDSAILVPTGAIDRMLCLDEAGKIIRTFDRWIPKRATTTSVSGRGSVAARRA
jgi:hypothetical protein